ncbi:MAG: response regulator [Endomicrobiia bacterium]|nr:response regulator [Endomicrobiia bacterium]
MNTKESAVHAGRKTVLIVDDDRDFAASAAALIEDIAVVALAHDGTSALRMAKKLRASLVILDVNLPDINGFRICRNLRDEPDFHGKIIMLTVRQEPGDLKLGAGAGADGYVQKPISNDEFVGKVREILA